MSKFQFGVEYARSGQSRCYLCRSSISNKSVRFRSFLYSDPQWYHSACFWELFKPESISVIRDVYLLHPDDQDEIRMHIAANVAGSSAAGGASKRPNPDDHIIKTYAIEYAKTGKDYCPVCKNIIPKEEIRIKTVKSQIHWHHLYCFGQIRGDLGFTYNAEMLPGFRYLELDDMKKVVAILKPVTVFGAPARKKKKLEGEESLVELKENQLVKSQNERFFKYKEELRKVAREDLVKILEYNGQKVPQGQERMLNLLSDCLTFGSLTPCPKCRGQIRFDNRAYICTGQSPELCVYRASDSNRVPTRIPLDVEKVHPFLASYRCTVKNRCLPNFERFADSLMSEKKAAIDVPVHLLAPEKPRLSHMEFLVLGKMQRNREEIRKVVEKAGGKVTTNVHDYLAAVIAPKKMVDEMKDAKMQSVKSLKIQVVAEEFLDVFMTVDPIQYIQTQSICDWGSDPRQRIRVPKWSPYEKSVPKSMTMELKDGSAVDPDSKLQHLSHVYQENNIKYDAVLALTDIQSGRNSFYKLQLLEADTGSRFWVFSSWGRIGTAIGDKKLEEMPNLVSAKYSFEQEYLEKTGNNWTEREMFIEWPGMYYPLDIDYGKEANNLSEYCAITSKLDPRVQELVKLIFDIDEMKKVMVGFELDMQKMPLGKLSKQQIKASYGVLNELSDLIGSNGSMAQLIEASNRFYTLIPHSFGVSVPPVLNTLEQVCTKMDMLQALLEIEVAYGMLTADGTMETGEVTNPIDSCYDKLKTDLVPLEKTDPEYASLSEYARNTHAVTHNMYKLDIEAIYKVRRTGEAARYETFKTLHNRRLLWHGSRLTNFVGILSHGLKIAPPEAALTGAMFGKGVYFADMVSKSANYSVRPGVQGPNPTETGLMLLCEVALGNMKECTVAENIQGLPEGWHSTWGKGQTYPNPKQSLTRVDGVVVPLGKAVINRSLATSLLYNEFIVYDERQVNIQYLFKVKFNYRQ